MPDFCAGSGNHFLRAFELAPINVTDRSPAGACIFVSADDQAAALELFDAAT